MQMHTSYWQKLAWFGVIGAFAGAGCVVSTSDNPSDAGASGGTSGSGTIGVSGASTAAGGSTAGSSGTAGATAGTGGTGGAAEPFVCDDNVPIGTVMTQAMSCVPENPNNTCEVCIQSQCCTEWEKCFATDPGNQCGFGGPVDTNGDHVSEIACYQECILSNVADGGIIDSDLKGMCDSQCATPTCPGNFGGTQTTDLAGCLHANCSTPCFGD